MGSNGDRLSGFVEKIHDELASLKGRGITLVGSFPEGGPLDDVELGPLNISAMGDAGVQIVGRALSAGCLKHLDGPAVIDIEKAATAYRALGTPYEDGAIVRALTEGRVRLQGTDGIRGPVSLQCHGNPVLHFGRSGEVTPELVEVMCRAFGLMAARGGVADGDARVVIAQDGRDAATGGSLTNAMKAGLAAAGLTVCDLGVAPTPAVPFAMAHLDVRLGVVLTASHNPASQNGVKFFVDGFKMLPEGPLGDFALSAIAYDLAHEESPPEKSGGFEDISGVMEAFAGHTVANIPADAREALKGLDILFDPANGSFTEPGRKVFALLGLDVYTVNDDPKGHNINEGGGVAEIEGSRFITAEEAAGSPMLASVTALIERAAASGGTAYALVMDGDGDRGFVLASDKGEGAYVSDGDALAFSIAGYMRESGLITDAEAPERHFIGSVESDITIFREVSRKLSLATGIACVGDKWLVQGARRGEKLAIGEEVSGHVLWPTVAETADGGQRSVLTGNGLLTALVGLAAAIRLGLSPEEMARPFPEGAFVTRYTYNVDKTLLFPESAAWDEDLSVIKATLDAAKGRSFDSWRVMEMSDEPDMLYVGLFDGENRLCGAVFTRNSGTENKTGVYGRGDKSLEPVLTELCDCLAAMHQKVLKDRKSPEYKAEKAVLEMLSQGPMAQSDVTMRLEALTGAGLGASEASSVLFGMRKEGLVHFCEGRIALA